MSVKQHSSRRGGAHPHSRTAVAPEPVAFADFDETPADATHRPILADKYKTKPCRTYTQHGQCPYESRCMFAHGPDELRTKEMNLRDGLTSDEAIRNFRMSMQSASHHARSHYQGAPVHQSRRGFAAHHQAPYQSPVPAESDNTLPPIYGTSEGVAPYEAQQAPEYASNGYYSDSPVAYQYSGGYYDDGAAMQQPQPCTCADCLAYSYHHGSPGPVPEVVYDDVSAVPSGPYSSSGYGYYSGYEQPDAGNQYEYQRDYYAMQHQQSGPYPPQGLPPAYDMAAEPAPESAMP